MTRAGFFPARFPGKCICGGSVKVGTRIAYDSVNRWVVACPKCRPQRKRGKIGQRFTVKVRGRFLWVASVRDPSTGRVFAMTFRNLAADAPGFCDYRPTGKGGEWERGNQSHHIDAPTWLTHEDVVDAIRQAREQFGQKAAA